MVYDAVGRSRKTVVVIDGVVGWVCFVFLGEAMGRGGGGGGGGADEMRMMGDVMLAIRAMAVAVGGGGVVFIGVVFLVWIDSGSCGG